jgi:hypothetical protein
MDGQGNLNEAGLPGGASSRNAQAPISTPLLCSEKVSKIHGGIEPV